MCSIQLWGDLIYANSHTIHSMHTNYKRLLQLADASHYMICRLSSIIVFTRLNIDFQ